jgi:hypothetical protein
MITFRIAKSVSSVVLLIALAGCSGQNNATNSPTPSPTVTTSAQAKADFAKAVTASVALATANGLTQTVDNSKYGVYTLVLDSGTSPKYQAAIKNPDGTIAYLFEADSFVPFFAQERLTVQDKISEADGTFTLTRNIEGSNQLYTFTTSNGTLESESMTDPTGLTVVSTLQYELPQSSIDILKMASLK